MRRSTLVFTACVGAAPLLLGPLAHAATLAVGPGQAYATVAAAIGASADGDTIDVMAGVYVNDFADIRHTLTLVAVGGRVTMRATKFIPNGKGILVADADAAITGFSFIGAKVTDDDGANGAGIRYDSGNLSITDCYFANNQNGILANPDPTGSIAITTSEFYHNGATGGFSAGYTHNLYVNEIATLDIESSYFHGANFGHEIKSRADMTIVRNTRVADGPTGTASYSIDLPNGGVGIIEDNRIEQGPLSQNPTIIAFGEEGNLHAVTSLTVSGNLIENDLVLHTPTGVWNQSGIPVTLSRNAVFGLTRPQLLSGPGTVSGSNFLPVERKISGAHPWK